MNHLHSQPRQPQRGMSLIVVLLLLVIVSMLGAASMQIAGMGEHGARNDRDMQLALQSAEAALIDAEFDLTGVKEDTNNDGIPDKLVCCARTQSFLSNSARFRPDGDGTGNAKGLWSLQTNPGEKDVWLVADFESESSANVISFGEFTPRSFQSAGITAGDGVQPALPPRYIIENVTELSAVRSGMVTGKYDSALPENDIASGEQLYRVTAMGFGPRSSTQTVLQTIYRN